MGAAGDAAVGSGWPCRGASVTRGTGVGLQERGGLLLKRPALGPRGRGTAFFRECSVVRAPGRHRGETTTPAWALPPRRGLPGCQLEHPKAGLTVISQEVQGHGNGQKGTGVASQDASGKGLSRSRRSEPSFAGVPAHRGHPGHPALPLGIHWVCLAQRLSFPYGRYVSLTILGAPKGRRVQ